MKITKLEAGVYIIEKADRVFKLSKVGKEWAIIYNNVTLIKCETKTESITLLGMIK